MILVKFHLSWYFALIVSTNLCGLQEFSWLYFVFSEVYEELIVLSEELVVVREVVSEEYTWYAAV